MSSLSDVPRHVLQEDWGERNTGKRTPALFVLDTAAGEVTPVAGLPEDSSVGQPIWEPNGSGALPALPLTIQLSTLH